MPQTIQELRAVLSGNLSSFANMIREGISQTQSMRKAWGEFASDAATSANRLTTVFGVTAGALAGAAARMGIGFNSIKEQSEIAFTTFLGDAKKAKQFVAELTDFAARTPFELPGLLESTKRLMAFGFEADRIIPMLTVVGDAAAGLGSPAAMDFIIRALGQIQAKGKVAAQEMNQLAEQGIPAWDFLAKKIGVDIPKAMKLAEDGAISANVAIPAILEGMNAKFGGMMEKQSTTMSGLWSTLMDRLRGWTGTMFEPLFNSLRNGMAKFLSGDSLTLLDNMASKVANNVGLIAREMDNVFAADPSEVFKGLNQVLSDGSMMLVKFIQWLKQSYPAFRDVAQGAYAFLRPLIEFLARNPQIVAALIALKVTGLLGVNAAMLSFGSAIIKTIPLITQLITKLIAMRVAAVAAKGSLGGSIASAAGGAVAESAVGAAVKQTAVTAGTTAAATTAGAWMGGGGGVAATTLGGGSGISLTAGGLMGGEGLAAAGVGGAAASGTAAAAGTGSLIAATGGVLALVAAVGALVKVTYDLYKARKDYFEAAEKAEKFEAQVTERNTTRMQQRLNLAMKEQDEAKRRLQLQELLAEAEKDAAGLEAQHRGAQKNAEQARKDSGWYGMVGVSTADSAKAEADAVGARKDAAVQSVEEIKRALAELIPSTGSAPSSGTGTSGLPEAPADELANIRNQTGLKGEKLDKAIQELFDDAVDKASPGFDKLKDVLSGALTDQQLSSLEKSVAKMKGADAEMAVELIASYKKLRSEGQLTSANIEAMAKSFTDMAKAGADAEKRAKDSKKKQNDYLNSLEELQGTLSNEELVAFAASFRDLRRDFIEGKLNEEQFDAAIQGNNQALQDSVNFKQKFGDLKGTVEDDELNKFSGLLSNLQDSLMNGDISLGQYKASIHNLNEEIDRAGQGAKGMQSFTEKVRDLAQQHAEQTDNKSALPQPLLQSYMDRYERMNNMFKSGAMTANELANATDLLQREMDAAGNAALKEFKAKEKARMAAGQFTQKEFQEAVRDKMASVQQQRFEQFVDQAVNGMLGLNQATTMVNQGFDTMANGMKQFDNGLQGAVGQLQDMGGQLGFGQGGNLDPQTVGAQFSAWGQWMNSVQGQIAGLLEQATMLESNMAFLNDEARTHTLEQIKALRNQAANLSRQAPPLVTPSGFGPRFRDPGLMSPQQQTNTIAVHLPNVNTFDRTNIAAIVAAIEFEVSRRGRNFFGT